MKKIISILTLAASVSLVACNNAGKDSVEKADSANQAKMDSPTVKEPIKTDAESTDFMVKAADKGMAEVKLGQLAQQKAVDSAVAKFAAMMIADHSAANEKVKALAADRNVTLPSEPDSTELKMAMDLSKKSGADFDKAYTKAMVKGHQDVLDMFKKASDNVKDADVKAFIDNTIPVIQHHLDMIKGIQKAMK